MLMTLAMLGFALEDMLIKQMSAGMPVGQAIVLMSLGGVLIFGAIALSKGEQILHRDLLQPAMIIRNLAEVVGIVGFVSAIVLTPLSTASAILQATPLVVTLGAALIFGEPVGWRRWTAILVGLFGVLLIIRPGMEGFEPRSLFAVLGVLGLAARDLATQRVTQSVSTLVISFYAFGTSIIGGFALLALGVSGSTWVVPGSTDMWRLILAMFIGFGAYYAIVSSTRIGEISIIAPFRYTRLVFALILGVLAFDERPDALTLTGAVIIVTSGVYTLWREARLRRASKPNDAAL
ncbi:MAG: DMT family transporter [Pseudomonadota bacterium]